MGWIAQPIFALANEHLAALDATLAGGIVAASAHPGQALAQLRGHLRGIGAGRSAAAGLALGADGPGPQIVGVRVWKSVAP